MRMKKIEIAALLGIVAAVVISSFGSFSAECKGIRESVLRLHILANSDSDADQALKLKVRDRILAETGETFNAPGKSQAEEQVRAHLDQIEAIAAAEIQANGYDYPVKAEVTNMYFETRQYGDLTMPAGKYDAVRITIGEAKGHNWWCVLYPPMCVPAAMPKQEVEDVLTQKQSGIVESNPKYEVRFAVVEAFEKLKNALFR